MKKRFLLLLISVFVFMVGMNIVSYAGNTPKVFVTTDAGVGNAIEKKDGAVPGRMEVYTASGELVNEHTHGKFKVRGNSTAAAPKKPFYFIFNEEVDMLGLGGAKRWTLLANAYDPTLIRNSVAFQAGLLLNAPNTLKSQLVELWVDGVFKGCYLLTGYAEVGKNRVDIDFDKGEFMLECENERVEEGVTYVETGKNYNLLRFAVKEPEEPTEYQTAHIQNILDETIKALKSKHYSRVQQYVDIDSFAAMFLVNELTENVDFTLSSTNIYYKDGKLYAGPIWDFDISLGNVNPDYASSYTMAADPEGQFAVQGFWTYLWEYEQFRDFVKNKLEENNRRLWWLYREDGYIDCLIAENREAIDRNYNEAGWKVNDYLLGTYRIPDQTYQENVDFLKDWLKKRHMSMCGIYGLSYGFEDTTEVVNGDGSTRQLFSE